MIKPPNPGSDEATKLGCTCAVMDNRRGAGIPSADGPLFWISYDCPLHGANSKEVKGD